MGSVVISDVVSHFPTSMFGESGGHHQSQDFPAAAVHQQRSSQLKPDPPHPDPNTSTSHIRGPSGDVQMSDAGDRPHRSDSEWESGAEASRTDQNSRLPPDAYPPSASSRTSHSSQRPAPSATGTSPASARPAPSIGPSSHASPNRIKVQSLSHIQSFATDESSPFSQTRSSSRRARRDPSDVGPQYEISEMPVTDIIEMVAGLLTKITSTNDRQHEHLHRQIPNASDGSHSANMSQQTSSVLAFHGKNVPSISILSYLSRIHKYCPTTYEVFLSLLVYFDRMTERVNSGPIQSLRKSSQGPKSESDASQQSQTPQGVADLSPPPSGSLEGMSDSKAEAKSEPSEASSDTDPYNLSHFFVVDSFNIHRLVIAGVTCASKFFSDIFYTNSRYAKVGGLPLVELNHLELQFLLLNDFRLSVPLEEMEAYGTMLVEFYAREVVAQQQAQAAPGGV